MAHRETGHFFAWAVSDGAEINGDPSIGNGTVTVYDLESNTQISSFENVADLVTDLHFSPDETMIVFRGSYPGYYRYDMQVWDIETETRSLIRESWFILPAYSQRTTEVVLALTLSLGLTNEYSYQVEIWNPKTNLVIQNIPISRNPDADLFAIPNRIPALALNSDATLVATGNDEGEITIWDIKTGMQLVSFQAYLQSVEQLAFTNDDKSIISLGSDDDNHTIRVWGITP
jgi:WD40 repeat protein